MSGLKKSSQLGRLVKLTRVNTSLLNIKILKFLDDLELDPSQKVGEIFEDIRTGDRFSTVKVYRNPPTPAELADTKRFESLPPDSAARPRKRPLPPLFADATRNERFSVINGPTWQPAQATDCLNEANKRRRVQNVDTDAERPLASQEVERSYGDALPVAGRGQSQINQVDEFRKPSHKKRMNLLPYETPLLTTVKVAILTALLFRRKLVPKISMNPRKKGSFPFLTLHMIMAYSSRRKNLSVRNLNLRRYHHRSTICHRRKA